MTSLFDSLIDLNKSLNKVHPLAAIWLSKPVWLEDKRTARIEVGDRLRIENKSLLDATPEKPATHEVIACLWNISNTVLYFELKDLKTLGPLILNAKEMKIKD